MRQLPFPDRLWRLLIAVAFGPVLMLAFAPYDIWLCAPLGAALLLLAVRGTSARYGSVLGLVSGLSFFVPLLHWSGIYVGPVPWLLLAVSQAVFFAALGAALAVISKRVASPFPLALLSACLWVGQEALRTRIPYGGFPWGRLSFASADAPWLSLAALGGAPLITFVIALIGALIVLAGEALVRRRRAAASYLALGAALLLLAPTLLPYARGVATPGERTATAGPTAVVAVVQGNVPRAGLDFNAQREAVLRNHVAASLRLAEKVRAGERARPDIVIWPENGSDIDPFRDSGAYALIQSAVDALDAPVLVGAVIDGPGERISNTGILWLPQSGPDQRYVKRHPVPFAEYIPMRSLARRVSSAVDRVRRDFAAGDRVGIFAVPRAAGAPDASVPGADAFVLGDVICFEVGYDGLVRDVVTAGAQIVAVQTNNATFGFTPQTEQQLVMSRVRAVEHQRATAIAATSGVSAVIDPSGAVISRAELFTSAVLVEEVPLGSQLTPATRLGPLPEIFLAMVGGLAVAVAALGQLRRRRAQTTSPASGKVPRDEGQPST